MSKIKDERRLDAYDGTASERHGDGESSIVGANLGFVSSTKTRREFGRNLVLLTGLRKFIVGLRNDQEQSD
jgi:hypothetical protein